MKKIIKKNTWMKMPFSIRKPITILLYGNYYRKLRALDINGYSLKPFDDYSCIFVHIPKTAGVSIAKSLFNNLAGGHINIEQYKVIFGKSKFKEYFKFSFVRNPWDRLLSVYSFLKAGGMDERDKEWAQKNLAKYKDFDSFVRRWVNKKNIYKKNHFLPQYEYVCTTNGIELDFLGYFETLHDDFEKIRKKLSISCNLYHLNKSKKKDYKEFYNRETLQIVAKVYRKDIDFFGYTFSGVQKIIL